MKIYITFFDGSGNTFDYGGDSLGDLESDICESYLLESPKFIKLGWCDKDIYINPLRILSFYEVKDEVNN